MTLPITVRIALVVAALACAAWLREGHYAIGLDFEGGAQLVLRPHGDPQATLLHALRSRPDAKIQRLGDRVAIELEGGDADDAHAIEHDLASDADLDSLSVIPSTWPRWLGRPLATLAAFAAALSWLGLLARPRAWPLALVGTLLLAWTITVVDNLALGGTLTLPLHLAGVLLGLAAAPATRPASGGDPLARLRAAWPAGVAILLVLVAATIVVTSFSHPPGSGGWATYGYFALKLARHPAIAVAAVAALSSIAATRDSTSRPSSRS